MEETLEAESQRARAITLEQAAYALVGLLAAGLRLYQLGLRPLYEGEAIQALASFRFVQGMEQAPSGDLIPAFFTGNVAAFTLFGASDIVARWLPTVAGTILVLVPYWFRHRLGRAGALVASLLLAISPSAVYFSRALDGSILVAACGLLVVAGLLNYVDTRRAGALLTAAIALGVGLCAGPTFVSLVLILVLFVLVLMATGRLLGREVGQASLAAAWRVLRDEKGLASKAGVALAATFGLTATAFVLHPAGVGHAADLIGAWAKGFLPESGGQPAIYLLLLLLRYEPLILVMGLLEGVRAALSLRKTPMWGRLSPQSVRLFPFTAFLVFWTIVGSILILVAGHRPAGNILLVVVPLALLAGQGVERVWGWLSAPGLHREAHSAAIVAAVVFGLGVFFYLQMAAFAFTDDYATVDVVGITLRMSTSYLLLALVAVVLFIGLAAVVWIWRGGAVLVAGCWLATVVSLALFGFRAMWGLSIAHGMDPRELMIAQATAPDVRVFAERAEALSLARSGDAHTLPLTVDAATGPVVAWYLRDFKDLVVVEGLPAPPTTAAAVTLAMQDLPIGETYRGRGFPLQSHWSPWGLWRQTFVRWLLFTEGSQPILDKEVVLWVSD